MEFIETIELQQLYLNRDYCRLLDRMLINLDNFKFNNNSECFMIFIYTIR